MLKKNKKKRKLAAKMISLGSHQMERDRVESEPFQKKRDNTIKRLNSVRMINEINYLSYFFHYKSF
jgi:hypothetical protein